MAEAQESSSTADLAASTTVKSGAENVKISQKNIQNLKTEVAGILGTKKSEIKNEQQNKGVDTETTKTTQQIENERKNQPVQEYLTFVIGNAGDLMKNVWSRWAGDVTPKEYLNMVTSELGRLFQNDDSQKAGTGEGRITPKQYFEAVKNDFSNWQKEGSQSSSNPEDQTKRAAIIASLESADRPQSSRKLSVPEFPKLTDTKDANQPSRLGSDVQKVRQALRDREARKSGDRAAQSRYDNLSARDRAAEDAAVNTLEDQDRARKAREANTPVPILPLKDAIDPYQPVELEGSASRAKQAQRDREARRSGDRDAINRYESLSPEKKAAENAAADALEDQERARESLEAKAEANRPPVTTQMEPAMPINMDEEKSRRQEDAISEIKQHKTSYQYSELLTEYDDLMDQVKYPRTRFREIFTRGKEKRLEAAEKRLEEIKNELALNFKYPSTVINAWENTRSQREARQKDFKEKANLAKKLETTMTKGEIPEAEPDSDEAKLLGYLQQIHRLNTDANSLSDYDRGRINQIKMYTLPFVAGGVKNSERLIDAYSKSKKAT